MIKGHTLQYDTPVWEPLLAVAGEPLVHQFMWMHEVELRDGLRLHAYKHIATRDYLHLCGSTGAAYRYLSPNNYVPVELAELLEEVLAAMWGDEPLSCEDGWAETAHAAIDTVRQQAALAAAVQTSESAEAA